MNREEVNSSLVTDRRLCYHASVCQRQKKENEKMKNLTIFYMEGCPYCRMGRQAVEALLEEEQYAGISVEWVNEKTEADRAAQYDYYYVPSVFLGEEKLFEAHPGDDLAVISAGMKKAFDAAGK